MAISKVMEGVVVFMEVMEARMISRGMMELMLKIQLMMVGRSRGVVVEVEGEGEGEVVEEEEGDSIKVMNGEVRARLLLAVIKLRSRGMMGMVIILGNRTSLRGKCMEVRLIMMRSREMLIGALAVIEEDMLGETVVSGDKDSRAACMIVKMERIIEEVKCQMNLK